MVPVFMAIASLLKQKKAQDEATNKQISDSLNLGQDDTNNGFNQVQVPQNNYLGNNAMGLLGNLFNKKQNN